MAPSVLRPPVQYRGGMLCELWKKGGATVTLVEFWPYVAPELEEDAEGSPDAEGDGSDRKPGGHDAPTEPDLPPIITD